MSGFVVTIGADTTTDEAGPISGPGTLIVDPGGVLEAGSTVSSGLNLDFAGGASAIFQRDNLSGGGLIVLADPGQFSGTIEGFGLSDQLVITPPSGQTIASAVISGSTLALLSSGGAIIDALAIAASTIPAGDSLAVVPVSALSGFTYGSVASNEVVITPTGPSPVLLTTPTLRAVAGDATTIPQLIGNDPTGVVANDAFTLTLSSTSGTFSENISLPAYVAGLSSNTVVFGSGDGAFDAGAVSVDGQTVALGAYPAGSTLRVAGSGTGTLLLTSNDLALLNLQAALVTYNGASGSITTTFSDGSRSTSSSIAVQTPGADSLTWTAISGGDFSTAGNWSGAGGSVVPGAADNLTFGSGNYAVTGNGAAGSINVTGQVGFQGAVDISSPGSTALTAQGGGRAGFTGVLLAQGNVLAGVSGSGEIDLFGPASNITGNVTIGVQAAGELQLSGVTDVSGNIVLGVGGPATVQEAGGSGSNLFSADGAELLAANITIGAGAGQSAVFSDTAGSLAATGVIAIGTATGSQGLLMLAGGTVSAPSVIIGAGGTLSNIGTAASTLSVPGVLLNQGTLDALGGSLSVNGTVDNQGIILAQAGTISLPTVIASQASGVLVAGTGGLLDLGNVSAAQTIDLLQNGTLRIDESLPTGSAGNAPTDVYAPQIEILAASSTILVGPAAAHLQITGESYANGTLDVSFTDAGGTQFGTLALKLAGLGAAPSFSTPTSNALVLPCFATGTRIDTDAGEVAVEDLRVGDLVCTADGGRRPVVWIGHREVLCHRQPQPERIYPVRVARGAFGAGLPWRDLYLSPDHSVFVDGVLIPVQYLVNGRSIAQTPVAKVRYWHVELERHDVILAEGLPVESYLDTGNRSNFLNGGDHVRLYPDFTPRTWSDACAELVVSGPRLVGVKRRLFELTGRGSSRRRGELAVLVGRRRLSPMILDRGVWHCTLPRGARTVVLSSPCWMPAACVSEDLDFRWLGVRVFGLEADGVAVALDSPSLVRGFHKVESGAEGMFRWTTGEAEWLVPPGTRSITLHLADDPALSASATAPLRMPNYISHRLG